MIHGFKNKYKHFKKVIVANKIYKIVFFGVLTMYFDFLQPNLNSIAANGF